MAFKKGISGNPGGRSGEKIFTEALRVELRRVDPKDKQKRQKLNVLAEKLVECALKDKQAWAFQQIADRLEGKAVHPLERREDDRTEISQFSEAELTAMLRSRMKIVPEETDEERPEHRRQLVLSREIS
jgi:Family of unknown function (DUF5681)